MSRIKCLKCINVLKVKEFVVVSSSSSVLNKSNVSVHDTSSLQNTSGLFKKTTIRLDESSAGLNWNDWNTQVELMKRQNERKEFPNKQIEK